MTFPFMRDTQYPRIGTSLRASSSGPPLTSCIGFDEEHDSIKSTSPEFAAIEFADGKIYAVFEVANPGDLTFNVRTEYGRHDWRS